MKTFALPIFMVWAVAPSGQAQGFQYRLSTPPGNFIIREVVVNEAGMTMSLFRKPPNIEYETDILPIENGGKPCKVRRLYFPEPLIWGYEASAEFSGTRLVFAYKNAQNSYNGLSFSVFRCKKSDKFPGILICKFSSINYILFFRNT